MGLGDRQGDWEVVGESVLNCCSRDRKAETLLLVDVRPPAEAAIAAVSKAQYEVVEGGASVVYRVPQDERNPLRRLTQIVNASDFQGVAEVSPT